MRKRIVSILLCIAVSASMISMNGCTGEKGGKSAAEMETSSEEVSSELEASSEVGESSEEGESSALEASSELDLAPVTLEYIAAINDCEIEDLICSYNDNGCINFLGAAFTEEPIRNAADAENSLEYLHDIAGLEGCEFAFYREDVSPVSGCIYYTFTQVSSSEIEDMPIAFSNGQVCVIVDQDGRSAGFSAYIINPNELQPVTSENYVDQAEAEALVAGELTMGNVLSEVTELTYWDDTTEANKITDAKVIPAWMIFSDEGRDGKPYTMYVVSAIRDHDGEAVIASRIGVSTPSVGDGYTSENFFEGMEDGGTYTYQLDMNWAFEAECGYEAEEVREVTVPVMHDPETGLYYLADYNERIAVANHYDFKGSTEVNALVSEHPEDINSWHFTSMTGPEGEAYLCDPNYVLASYDVMIKTYNMFKDRYGYNSVDMSGMPILLLVYVTGGDYPEDPMEFESTASNMEQWHDWEVFGTSPSNSMCVDVGAMAHEFSHGINLQFSSTQYRNEMGAVMEGYADSIGQNIANLYGYTDPDYVDYVGGLYFYPLRCFSDPYVFHYAKYINGPYFADPVNSEDSYELDHGGIHENSSVVNYLCYCLSHSDDDQAKVIDTGSNLDMFVETLYCATYSTGFEELGAYLRFAAKHMNLSEEELEYVNDTIYRLGFAGDGSELEQLIAEDEDVYQYTVKVTGDAQDLEPYGFGAVLYVKDTGERILSGGADSEYEMSMIMLESLNCYGNVYVLDPELEAAVGGYLVDDVNPDEVVEMPFSCYDVELGETLDLGGTIYIMLVYDYETGGLTVLREFPDEHSITPDAKGIYSITVKDDQGGKRYILVRTI